MSAPDVIPFQPLYPEPELPPETGIAPIAFVPKLSLVTSNNESQAALSDRTFNLSVCQPSSRSPELSNPRAQDKDVKTAYDRASQSVQKILALAQKNGIAQSDISSGVLTIRPFYEGDRKKRAWSFLIPGQLTLRVRDFAKLEPLPENSVDGGSADFRSLTYSLSDEEAAKQKAVAEAVQHSWDRANTALKPRGQKAGALRFVNVDLHNLAGVSEINLQKLSSSWALQRYDAAATNGHLLGLTADKTPEPPPPPPFNQPKKITVNATVECACQIL